MYHSPLIPRTRNDLEEMFSVAILIRSSHFFIMTAQEFSNYVSQSSIPIKVFQLVENNRRSTIDLSLINNIDLLNRMTQKAINDFPNSEFIL